MDDKTLNLWRQIEGYRRRTGKQAAVRSKPETAPPRPANTN
jgi:hypothetical protein